MRDFVNKYTKEYKPEEGHALTDTEKTDNEIRKELLGRLSKGATVSSAEDIADVVKIHAPSQIDAALESLNSRIKKLVELEKYMNPKAREETQKQIDDLIKRIMALEGSKTTMLSAGDKTLAQFFVSLQNGDINPEVGRKISQALKNGDMAGAIDLVIQAQLDLLPKDDPGKKKWSETMSQIGKNTLFAGGGLAALALYFAIMGGKREQ